MLESLGILDSLLQLVLTINMVLLIELLVLSVPVALLLRDAYKTAKRFDFVLDPSELTRQKEDAYLDAAEREFAENSDVAAFIYGHTHLPSVRRLGERAVINTGTWIKQFEPVKVRFGILPRIYVPSFFLSSFRIAEEHDSVVIEYRRIEKLPGQELTWLQRLLARRGNRAQSEDVPQHTVLS